MFSLLNPLVLLVVLLLKVSQVIHDKVGQLIHLPQCVRVRLFDQGPASAILPVVRHLHLVSGDRLDDQRGDVEAEPEGEEERHVPQLAAQVVVTVGLYSRLSWRFRRLGSHRLWWWWWRLFVVLVVVHEFVVVKVVVMMRIVVVNNVR